VNKNTTLALVLILLTVFLFTSPQYQRFYYTKILKKPLPEVQKNALPAAPAPAAAPAQNDSAKGFAVPALAPAISEKAGIAKARDTLTAAMPVDSAAHGDTLWVITEKMICGISELGGRIVSLKTREYRYLSQRMKTAHENDTGGIELVPAQTTGGPELSIDRESLDGLLFAADSGLDTIRVTKSKAATVSLRAVTANGIPLVKEFSFSGSDYRIGCAVRSVAVMGRSLDVGWRCGIAESEDLGIGQAAQYNQRTVHYLGGNSVEHLQEKKETKEISGLCRWVGISTQYFLVAIIADTLRDADIAIKPRKITEVWQGDDRPHTQKTQIYNYAISYRFASIEDSVARFSLYAGPSRLSELQRYGLGLEKTLFGSVRGTGGYTFSYFFFRADIWFPVLCMWTLWLLQWFYTGVKDYGVVIILLTLLSKIITFPLTQSSMKSMGRMKDLQPKINHIRERYKHDPRKMNEEIMTLYKAEGINPLNPGCLPMFLQMPIFFALFVVLRKAIELRGAPTVLIPWIHDLSIAEALPVITPFFQKVLPNGLPMYGTTVGLLPIVMAILTYFQNKMTIKDPNQKMLIWFMPIFLLALFNSFSSGLVLYWTFSNALGIIQQVYTNKINEKKIVQSAAIMVKKPQKKR
jgi:YidC/Oxa1 family membrane protein insertase